MSDHSGSIVGGTRITVKGTNLDGSTEERPLEVYIGGNIKN